MEKSSRIKSIEQIRFEGLTFAHEGYDSTLKQADFVFPSQKIVWIKSPEGAGKSTLLQLMAGLLTPQLGTYFLNEEDVSRMTFEEFLCYRLNIGYTFDFGGLINNRTLQDNLLLPLTYHHIIHPKKAHERVNELVERFDLGRVRNERPAHVPGRVRKLVCVLRALVIQPEMLLMDDPTVGLGAETAQAILSVIEEQRNAGQLKHVFISSYDDKFMSQMDHEVVFMDGGQLYHQQDESHKKVVHL